MPARSRTHGRLTAIAAVILSLQAAVLALGLARVCAVPDHLHRGKPAPDCRMHHRASGGGSGHAGHANHAHGTPAAPQPDSQVSCKCSSSVSEMFGGGVAILAPDTPADALTAATPAAPAHIGAGGQLRVPPSLPPPRPRSL